MYINARINTGKVKFWECFDEVDEYVESMFNTCESVTKKPIDIDNFISDLETFGDTRAKSWELSCANSFANSKDCYLELMVTFDNGFYVCFEPSYLIEGKC